MNSGKEPITNKQKLLNLTLVGIVSQVGCVTLVIIIAALLLRTLYRPAVQYPTMVYNWVDRCKHTGKPCSDDRYCANSDEENEIGNNTENETGGKKPWRISENGAGA